MSPDQGSIYLRPFTLWNAAQPTEPYHSGSVLHFECIFYTCKILYCYILVVWKIVVHWVTQSFQILIYLLCYTIKKYLNILPLISSEKPLIIGKLSSSCWQIDIFKNSYCFAENSSVIRDNKYCWLIVTDSLCSFLRICLPNTHVWKTVTC